MKTHCKRGHERIPSNLFKGGACKKCSGILRQQAMLIPEKRARYLAYVKEYKKTYILTPAQKLAAKKKAIIYREQNRAEYLIKHRNQMLKTTYKITIEEYNKLFNEQNGCCAICLVPQEKFKKRLAVDHNHVTNEIRGLLCSNCNIKVVSVVENFSHLIPKAIEYLSKLKKPIKEEKYS